jgi:flagellar biosynthesis GTPase FlhF
LDETETLGPILSLSIRMEKPISFFSSGQRIPEDLAPAAADTLLDLIMGRCAAGEPGDAHQSKYGVVAA